MTTPHTSGAADLPVITSKDRQFLHDNPNTDDLVAWVQDYAARAVALAAGQAVAPEKGITVDFSHAHELLEMFGGEPGLVTLHHGNEKSHIGAGLYAWWTDMPEEGAQFLGAQPDDEAVPVRPAPPAMDGGDAGRLERERICAAIKAEDDYCVDHGDYMLDSDDCIKIVRGEWVRPDFAIGAARAAQKEGA